MVKKYDELKNEDLTPEQRLATLGIESKPLIGNIVANTFIASEILQKELDDKSIEKLKVLLSKIDTSTSELKELHKILVK